MKIRREAITLPQYTARGRIEKVVIKLAEGKSFQQHPNPGFEKFPDT
jgi:hypothetical protein